jgi:NAD(P)-dependent dehydrogenase (short-subunit alcohol dehydrogenase family)
MSTVDRRGERVLVTGANRGLGLDFVRQYLEAGATVFAGCRVPADAEALRQLASDHADRLIIQSLDVRDGTSIDAVVDAVRSHGDGHLDVLINNAGTSPCGEEFSNIRAEDMLEVLRVNTVAPLIVAQRCHDLLAGSTHPRIVNISSSMGALACKDYGRHYSYASGKAALNMITRAEACDLAADGIVVVSLHPGWVRTDLGGPNADLSPEESVQGLIAVIDRLESKDSGKFLTWQDEEHPW